MLKNPHFICTCILLLAIVIRGFYLFITPAGQTPDEIFILRRIWNTVGNYSNHSVEMDNQKNYPNNEYYYPPLYFVSMALLIKLLLLFGEFPRNFDLPISTFYIQLRLVSLILSALSLILIWKIINKIEAVFEIKLSVLILLSLVPSFASFAMFPNHNTFLFFLMTLFIYFLTLSALPPFQKSSILGIIGGLALITKMDAFLIFPIFITYNFLSQDKRTFIKNFGIFLLVSMISGGWWYIYNYFDSGWFYNLELFHKSISEYAMPFSFENYIKTMFSITITSFFNAFGFDNSISIGRTGLNIQKLFLMITLYGFLIWIFKKNTLKIKNKSIYLKKIIYSLFSAFIVNLIFFLQVNLKYAFQPQGRYFYPSILFLGILTILGLSSFFKKDKLYLLPVFLFTFWIFFNWWSIGCILNTFYNINILLKPMLCAFSSINLR